MVSLKWAVETSSHLTIIVYEQPNYLDVAAMPSQRSTALTSVALARPENREKSLLLVVIIKWDKG
jgi:hypothetical protein